MNYLDFAIETAKNAGNIAMKHFGIFENIETKEDEYSATPIQADIDTDNFIVSQIKQNFPDHGIFSEESDTAGDSDFIWRIDPIDGTNNFKRGHHEFAISISLEKGSKHLLGLVYKPFYQELYYAEAGKSAWSNKNPNKEVKKIFVSKEKKLDEAVISINTSFFLSKYNLLGLNIIKKIGEISPKIRLRALESESIELTDIANGCHTCHLGLDIKPWDYAAGTLIIKEAGGRVTDFNGNELSPPLGISNIAASNKLVHEELLEIINSALST